MSARSIALSLILAAAATGPVVAQMTSGASPVWPPSATPAASEGEQLFSETCARCHRAGGMGTGILSRRKGIAADGQLEKREDLVASFIKVVVRAGTGNMPRISRAEVSDRQLAKIADYLSRGKP
jgi:mono/diheme cytochrome c family protein